MTAVLPETDDAVAIAELHDLLALQEKGFRAEPYPTLDVRRERLVALAAMMVMDRDRDRIREAMSDDVAVHPELVTDLVEASLPPYGAAQAVVDAVMGGDDAPVQPQGGV